MTTFGSSLARGGILLVALLGLSAGVSCAGPEGDSLLSAAPVPSHGTAIFQGYPSVSDPQVFALVIQSGTDVFFCSSTLIGERTLLTAAHCVVDGDAFVATNQLQPLDPATFDFSPDLVFIRARIWRAHPDYDPTVLTSDIALVGLEHSPQVSPKAWNSESISGLRAGAPLRLVGYGDSTFSSGGETGFGRKRTGNAQLQRVDPTLIHLSLLLSTFCFGDSGGPNLHTFPDGVERVVGVTSYGGNECGGTADEGSTRVDAFSDFIQTTLAEFDPPSCDPDGLCVPGCAPEDVDCTCAADGFCNPDCPDPTKDPDCDAACAENGLCARAACGTSDVDCRITGRACMVAADCAGGACVADAQHPEAYCSHPCSGDGECEAGYACQGSACRHVPLPEVAPDGLCTPGSQFCTGGTVCARPSDGGVVQCRLPCGQDLDCPTSQHCAGDPPDATYCDDRAVTVPPVTPPAAPGASKGCSSAGGQPWVWAGVLIAAWLSRAARPRRTGVA